MRNVKLLFILAALIQGCAPSTNLFDTLGEDSKATTLGYENTRREVGAQGSGSAQGGIYSVSKVTVGGSYLRTPASATGKGVTPGLHGNPLATQ
jgi:hypothetical protein